MKESAPLRFERQIKQSQQLKIRLAENDAEIEVAQRLRYQVFHAEMGATPKEAGIDRDHYDQFCDHLLVLSEKSSNPSSLLSLHDGEVVGTYRLLPQAMAVKAGGFYSAQEFDVSRLIETHPDLSFLELGRSCILPEHRGTSVMELLWQGIWNYVRMHRFDVMLGCASFGGVDPLAHREALSFLDAVQLPPEWLAEALTTDHQNFSYISPCEISAKRAISDMPPLVKGYLRLGCHFGKGFVIDRDFNTTDVLIILPVSSINPRYFARFGAPL